MLRRWLMVAALLVALVGGSVVSARPAVAQEENIREPGIGLCVPLPDPPLILDWTIRALKLALVGEVDCGL